MATIALHHSARDVCIGAAVCMPVLAFVSCSSAALLVASYCDYIAFRAHIGRCPRAVHAIATCARTATLACDTQFPFLRGVYADSKLQLENVQCRHADEMGIWARTMREHRVHPSHKERRVHGVRLKARPLCHCTTHNGARRCRKLHQRRLFADASESIRPKQMAWQYWRNLRIILRPSCRCDLQALQLGLAACARHKYCSI